MEIDPILNAALAAFVAKTREEEGEAARWPDDYDDVEQRIFAERMRSAIAAHDAARARLLVKPGTNATYSIDDMIREAQRELKWREKTIWNRSPEDFEIAKRRAAIQHAIVDTLVRVKMWHWPETQGGSNV